MINARAARTWPAAGRRRAGAGRGGSGPGKISKQLRKTVCILSNNTMAFGGYKNLSKSQSFTSEVGSLGGVRHYEQPGSRDDAVLVLLGILSLSLSLRAGDGVVGHV